MAKEKKQYVCTTCGTALVRWEGRCPHCKSWDTLEEQIIRPKTSGGMTRHRRPDQPQVLELKNIPAVDHERIKIPEDSELNQVLGGGLVPGSLILLGGQPGIGKSTLMLQLATRIGATVLYVSGEESPYQIKMRADRIADIVDHCLIYCDTSLERILAEAEKVRPKILLIDSIQTVISTDIESLPGTVSQVKTCAGALQTFAKQTDTIVILIGHITKDGSLAGPKLLEHIVDVVLHFEGDHNYVYRILRTLKNRFGSTDEIGIYEMYHKGLKPITNPSELLISPIDHSLSGATIGATLEGVRPLLIESQALVSPTSYGHPQRSATGFDNRRLSMLLAVLEKKLHLFFSQQDVFLNIAGGIRVSDPAIDLALIAALVSSYHDIAVDRKICFAGEVGLSGEVRTVQRIGQRILEADRLGFDQIFISKYHQLEIQTQDIEVISIAHISELVDRLFT